MIKPASQEKLDTVPKNCLREMLNANKKLCVISKQVPIGIPFSEILYADVQKRTVSIHTAGRIVKTDRGFYTVINPLLEDKRFMECYKGIVVNMEHIQKQIDDDFLLDNGEKYLSVNERKKKSSAYLWNTNLKICEEAIDEKIFFYNNIAALFCERPFLFCSGSGLSCKSC